VWETVGTAIEIVLLTLAVARITILITRDEITEPLRARAWRFSSPVTTQDRDQGVIGSIIECPDCCGVWVGLAASFAYVLAPHATATLSLPFALGMAASFIARKGGYS
jgi:hypothetical protein